MNSSITPLQPDDAEKLAQQFRASWEPPAPDSSNDSEEPFQEDTTGSRGKGLLFLIAAVALMGGLGWFVFAGSQETEGRQESNATVESETSKQLGSATRGSEPPLLSVRAVPKLALLFIDGKKVSNPFEGEVIAGTRHVIKASAPGFREELMSVQLDRSKQIEIKLEKDTTPHTAPPTENKPINRAETIPNAASRVPTPKPPSVDAEPALVRILVRTQPRGASLQVDGLSVDNPFSKNIKAGDSIRVRASARAYEPQEAVLTVDKPMVKVIRLKQARVKRVRPKASPKKPANSEIVTDNPY